MNLLRSRAEPLNKSSGTPRSQASTSKVVCGLDVRLYCLSDPRSRRKRGVSSDTECYRLCRPSYNVRTSETRETIPCTGYTFEHEMDTLCSKLLHGRSFREEGPGKYANIEKLTHAITNHLRLGPTDSMLHPLNEPRTVRLKEIHI